VPAPNKFSAATLSTLLSAALIFIFASASAVARGAKHAHGQHTRSHTSACVLGTTSRHAQLSRRCHPRKPRTKTPKPERIRPARQPRLRHSSAPATTAPSSPEESAPSSAQTSATAHAAAIAAVLETPCQNTELTPEAENLPLVRAAILCLINRKRAESGESPLKANAQLEQAAESHSQELVADDYFAHVSPSGETPVDRIRETGYIPNSSDGYVIGENLAWGTYQLATPQAIVAAWIASPGHLANILEAQYTETGIGVTPAVPSSLAPESPGATYAQEFGVIIP